ncbi:MAG TPA: glycosyltransferase family 1 protein [Crenalkalicoccus sp.]|nr:glycosyltransferase family 1 protein [Crenalkalicoccus sp.]
MAYARHALGRPGGATFVAEMPWGFAALPRDAAARLLDAVEESWATGAPGAVRRARGLAAGILGRLALGQGRAALDAALAAWKRPVFLLVSHRSLDRAAPIAALCRRGVAFVPLLHDLIPLTHPEYARPPQVARHARRLATIAAEADGVITNSAATAGTLLDLLGPARIPPVTVAPLGIAPSEAVPAAPATAPGGHFTCLGTIEPRKNHLLLLHLWRDLVRMQGAAAPRLLLLGRRGWENENVLDLLERCAALRGPVQEPGPLPDAAVRARLAGSRALLFPSFAEGYGLPLAEALALGVPVLCSDLPALREVGGEVPDYLDPLDGAAWRRAVLDYAAADSPRRAAQLARLRHWSPPRWADHFDRVEAFLETVAAPVRRPLPARPDTVPPEPVAPLAEPVPAA